MEFLDFSTLVFIVAAVFIFLRLRSVLGQRTGHERPPFDPYSRKSDNQDVDGETENDNVVAMPQRKSDKNVKNPAFAQIDAIAPKGTEVNDGLRAILKADASFSAAQFIDGAKMAYEMIVLSFADGDRKTLENLLSRDVYDGFVSAIDEREKRNEIMQSSFVGIRECDIVGAEIKGSEAYITMKITSEMITSTVSATGETIEGDPEQVEEVRDVWTFMRDTKARDPNWKLDATEADE